MKLLKKSLISQNKEEEVSRNAENLKVPSLNLSTLKHVKEYTS